MPKRIYDWSAIQRYHDEGHGFVQCRKKFGCSHYLWMKAIGRGALDLATLRSPSCRRYNWSEIRQYYEQGNSYRQAAKRFGFGSAAWYKAIQRGDIKPRPFGTPIQTLLMTGKSRNNIKHRLLRVGLLENCCGNCGLCRWRGRPLSMHIDHINGVKNDNRLENLRMLCPNCHSQTPTYGGRNARRGKRLQESQSSCSITLADDPG